MVGFCQNFGNPSLDKLYFPTKGKMLMKRQTTFK